MSITGKMLRTALITAVATVFLFKCFENFVEWQRSTIRMAGEVRNFSEMVEFCRKQDIIIVPSARLNRAFCCERYRRSLFLKCSLFLDWKFDELNHVEEFQGHGFSELKVPRLGN
jgi:hypothetical protein